jgi:hypothetical protein
VDPAKIGVIAVRLHQLATSQKKPPSSPPPTAALTAPPLAKSAELPVARRRSLSTDDNDVSLARKAAGLSLSPTRSHHQHTSARSSSGSRHRHRSSHRRRGSEIVPSSSSSSSVAAAKSVTIVPGLPKAFGASLPSIVRVLTRRVEPASLSTAERVCVVTNTWLSGAAVEVPIDSGVYAHVASMKCDACALPVVDERKLKQLGTQSCYKKSSAYVFLCDVCAKPTLAGAGSRHSGLSPRSPRGRRSAANDDLIELDDQLVSPRSRRQHRHASLRAREPRVDDVCITTVPHKAAAADQLSFASGDFITIESCPPGAPMWRGRLDNGTEGLFRAAHVTVLGSRGSHQVRRARRAGSGANGAGELMPDVEEDLSRSEPQLRTNIFATLFKRGGSAKVPSTAAAKDSEVVSLLDMLKSEPPPEVQQQQQQQQQSKRPSVIASKSDNEVVSLLDMLHEEPPPKTPRAPVDKESEVVSLLDMLKSEPPPELLIKTPRKIEVLSLVDMLREEPPPGFASPRKLVIPAEDRVVSLLDMLHEEPPPGFISPRKPIVVVRKPAANNDEKKDAKVNDDNDDDEGSYTYSTDDDGDADADRDDKKPPAPAAAPVAPTAPVGAVPGRPQVTGKAAKLLGFAP